MTRPEWTYCASIYLPKKHCMLYRDDRLGCQLQVMTKTKWVFSRGSEEEFYFIDGSRKVFRSEERLVRELEKRTRTGRARGRRLRAAWRRIGYALNIF